MACLSFLRAEESFQAQLKTDSSHMDAHCTHSLDLTDWMPWSSAYFVELRLSLSWVRGRIGPRNILNYRSLQYGVV